MIDPNDALYAERVAGLREVLSTWLADPGAPLDVARARDLGAPLLEAPARDLRVWTWITLVEVAADGGAAPVLAMAQALGREHPVLPRRPAAQHEAIAFFHERLALVAKDTDAALAAAVTALDDAIAGHLGDGFPRALRAAAAVQASSTAHPVAASGAAGVDPLRSLLAEATRLREAQPEDPRGYQLARRVVWLRLESPRDEAGLRSFPAPSPATRAAVEQADPRRVVEACEAALRAHPAWLDVHRHEAQALEALGRAEVAEAVSREIRALATTHPWLPHTAFVDGSPVADAATRAWLAPPVPPASAPSNAARDTVLATMDAARRDLAAGRTSEAMASVRRALRVGRLPAAEYDSAVFRDLYTLALEVLSVHGAETDPVRTALRVEWTARRWALAGDDHE
jgi:hypothetical protein